jgi:ubiquinone/menaquinone biosynthesis C-methylase UbiE
MSSSSENEINLVHQLPLEHLMELYQINQAVFTLIRLQLPKHLAKQNAQSLVQLAKHFAIEVHLLEPLMQIAVELVLVKQDEQHRYALTSKGQQLCPDTSDSLTPYLSFLDDAYMAWGGLQQSLQTGQSAFIQVHGMNFYEYIRQYPEKNHYFNHYMEQTTEKWLADVKGHYLFAGHLVDMGGNQGALTALILQHYPELTATLFDLKQALLQADEVLSNAGVRDRCQIVEGDFFQPQTIPQQGDIYLFSRVLFNWSDEQVVQILSHCRQAMPKTSQLLILEFIQPDTPFLPTWLTYLNLWVMFGARIRTQTNYDILLTRAGFETLRWMPCSDKAMNLFFLEARPIW